MNDKSWPKSTCTNAVGAPEGTFSIAKLKALVREMDRYVSDDVIAVSMLFPPDKCLQFSDHRGTVHAMGMRAWHALKAQAPPIAPGSLSLHPFGMPVVFEGDDAVWAEVRDRIVNSIKAAVETSEYMERLRFAEKLLRPNPDGSQGGTAP